MDEQERNGYQAEKKALIEANRAYWSGTDEVSAREEWIYVYHCLPHEFGYSVHEDIVAKGLQEKERLPVAVITDGHGDELLDELDASFGFEESRHVFYSKFDSAAGEERVNEAAMRLTDETYGDKAKLAELEYRGIACGDVLHDYILRKNEGEVFDCFEVSKEQYFKLLKSALAMIDKAYEMFSERKPAYIVTSECLFIKGLVASVAREYGAKVLVISNDYPDTVMRILPGRALFKELKTTEFFTRQVEAYLEQGVPEEAGEKDLFVYEGPQDAKPVNLLERLGISNGKKNVFILMRIFSDVPREGHHHHFFYEYNDWFLSTLKMIKEIPDVNWIIKDHPMSPRYKQDAYVKKVFLEHKTPNMYWCDRTLTGIELKDIADCIITCVGEAAMEYWAYGVPTITVSTAYFSNWGISYNMKTLEEYENTLKHIGDLKKPPEQSAKRARECLLALKHMGRSEDELACLFLEARKKQLESYKTGGNDSDVKTFCEKYIELLKKTGIQSSTIYQLTRVYDVK